MTSHLHDSNDVSSSRLEDLLVLPLLVAPAFVSLGGVTVPEAGSHVVVVAEPDECDGHQAGVLVRVNVTKPCVGTNILSNDTCDMFVYAGEYRTTGLPCST